MTALGDFSAGDVLTAADLNAIGTWQSYTPVLTATVTSPNLGTSPIQTGQYCQINDFCVAQIFLAFGSSSSAGTGEYRISLPVEASPASNINANMGWGWIYDANLTNAYSVITDRASSTTCRMYLSSPVGSIGVQNANPFAWTTSDQMRITLVYRTA